METNNKMCAIIIEQGETDGTLILSDKGESFVNRNEVVTWIIHPDSGVESITAIPAKEGSTNVFTSGPYQLGSSKVWQGRIRNVEAKEAKPGEDYVEEEYAILWKDSADKNHTYDPTIRVNI